MLREPESGSSGSSSGASSTRTLKRLAIADSGFGSVRLVVAGFNARYAFICSIKQAHSLFPKAYIEQKTKDASSETLLVHKASIDGVEVLCAGHKFKSRKVFHFCWPVGAASWVPGEPYIQDGSSYRLSVFSHYFDHSNKVYVGNELR